MDWRRRLVLAEAGAFVCLAALAITFLPFRHVGRLAARKKAAAAEPAGAETVVVQVRWAVDAWGERVPFKAMCFQRGLAAQWMLHRRGIPSTLFFGAAPDEERKLVAHVWVRYGDRDVIGCEGADRFPVLARFPSA